jgi:hypothetical protein
LNSAARVWRTEVTERLNLKDACQFLRMGKLKFERIARECGWVAERGPYRQKFYTVEDLKAFRPDGNIETAARPDRLRERPCLRCRKPFASEGAHHRLCGDCREYAATVRSNFDE